MSVCGVKAVLTDLVTIGGRRKRHTQGVLEIICFKGLARCSGWTAESIEAVSNVIKSRDTVSTLIKMEARSREPGSKTNSMALVSMWAKI